MIAARPECELAASVQHVINRTGGPTVDISSAFLETQLGLPPT